MCDLALVLPGLLAHGADAVPGAAHLDAGLYFVQGREFARQAVLAGRLPEWNPHLFVGGPFLAMPQGGLAYPPNLLLLPLPVGLGFLLGRLAHLLLGQAGTWLLARRLGASGAGGFVSGLAFTFGSQFAFRLQAGHVGQLDAQAWIPWLVLAALLTVRGAAAGGLLLGAFAGGMQLLAGYPQMAQVTWFALAALVPLLARSERLAAGAALRRGAAFLLGVPLAAAALGAVVLLPALELAARSARSGFDPAWTGLLSFPPAHLVTALAPSFYGDGRTAAFWGQGYPWETTLYCGAGALALAGLAAARLPWRRSGPWIVTGGLMLLLALGRHNPLFLPVAEHVPLLGLFRGPVKYLLPLTLCGALLAGLGLDQALRRFADRGRALRRVCLALALVAAAVLLARGGGLEASWAGFVEETLRTGERYHPPPAPPARLAPTALAHARSAAVEGLGWALGALLLTAAAAAGRAGPRPLRLALLALVALELVGYARGRVDFFPAATRLTLAPGVRPLLPDPGRDPYRVALLGGEEPDRAQGAGLQTLGGYDAVLTARTNRFYNAWEGRPAGERRFVRHVERVDAITRFLGQRYLVLPAGAPPPAPPPGTPPLVRLGQAGDRVVWRDPAALPRVFLVERAEVLADLEAVLARVTAGGFDPRAAVLLEEPPPAPPPGGAPDPALPPGCELRAYAPGEVLARVSSPRPAYLVFTEAGYPGWSAAVDGEPAPLLTAYGLVMAVPVPAGRHEVALRFASLPVRAGLALSALAALALAGAAARVARRGR